MLKRLGSLLHGLKGRAPEARATLDWVVHAWLRPPDADAGWEQRTRRRP